MADDTTTTTTDESNPQPESLGDATARIELDGETYDRVREAYTQAVADGFSGGFDTFAMNHCSVTYTVTVDGEEVRPLAEE